MKRTDIALRGEELRELRSEVLRRKADGLVDSTSLSEAVITDSDEGVALVSVHCEHLGSELSAVYLHK